MSFLVTLLVAWLLADLIAGFWHWIEDRYFDEKWPIIGEYIAKPNTLHHAQPSAFLAGSYWHRNWTTIVPAATALAIALLCGAPLWLLLTFAFVSQANEVHAWAHQRVKSRFIRGLQEFGLLQSPRHHGVHHKAPFDCRYCVMTDWLNPVLDRIGFWLLLEWLLKVLFGIKVKPNNSKPAVAIVAMAILLIACVAIAACESEPPGTSNYLPFPVTS